MAANFDDALGFRVISSENGRAVVEVDVKPAVQNLMGNLHGGAVATLVDIAGTIAIMSGDRHGRFGVTTDLNISYFSPSPAESTVVAVGTVLKIGKTLAFVSVDLRRKADDVLVAQGRMTKHLGG